MVVFDGSRQRLLAVSLEQPQQRPCGETGCHGEHGDPDQPPQLGVAGAAGVGQAGDACPLPEHIPRSPKDVTHGLVSPLLIFHDIFSINVDWSRYVGLGWTELKRSLLIDCGILWAVADIYRSLYLIPQNRGPCFTKLRTKWP